MALNFSLENLESFTGVHWNTSANNQNENTTQIYWQSSSLSGTVMSYSNSTMTDDGVTVDGFSDPAGDTITANVRVPRGGQAYNVCIAATNECGELIDPLSCTTVRIIPGMSRII